LGLLTVNSVKLVVIILIISRIQLWKLLKTSVGLVTLSSW